MENGQKLNDLNILAIKVGGEYSAQITILKKETMKRLMGIWKQAQEFYFEDTTLLYLFTWVPLFVLRRIKKIKNPNLGFIDSLHPRKQDIVQLQTEVKKTRTIHQKTKELGPVIIVQTTGVSPISRKICKTPAEWPP